MEEITLNMPIYGNNVTATATEEETSFSKAEKAKGVFTAHLPGYASPSLNDDSVSAYKLEVEKNQDALKVDDLDFRLHYDWNPLSQDIASTLVEDLRETAEKRYHTKDIMIRLDLNNPTCYVGKSNNNSTDDSTAPLENVPKAPTSAHHHKEPTPPANPTTKPKMPVNNENITRKQLEELVNRLVKEREEKIKELYEKKLLKQKQIYNDKLKELKKQYNRQLLQREQPQLELPKKDQLLVNWVSTNWKYLEPTFKKYANALYTSHTERLYGGKDGKGDNYVADQYIKQAQEIMALQFEEFFKHTKQKSLNAQSNKDKHKSKDKELGK